MKLTPSRAARLAAGLTLAEAARLVERSPAYLAALERTNCFTEGLDWRLARLYSERCGAPVTRDLFLPLWSGVDPWSLVPRTPAALACQAAGGVRDGTLRAVRNPTAGRGAIRPAARLREL